MSDDRDLQLGGALNALPVPARDDEFLADLERRLALADSARSRAGAGARPFSRRLTRGRRKWLLLAAAVALVAALLLAGVPGTDRGDPQVATAAQLARLMDLAWSRASTVQGTIVSEGGADGAAPNTATRWFAATAQGDWRIDDVGSMTLVGEEGPVNELRSMELYNAATNIYLDVNTLSGPNMQGMQPEWRVEAGYWSGTGPRPLLAHFLNRLMHGSVQLRAALAEADPELPVEETVYHGRPAWRIVFPSTGTAYGYHPNAETTNEIIVDEASGLALHGSSTSRWSAGSRTGHWEFTVSDLRVDEPISAGTFSTDAPRGVDPALARSKSPQPGHLDGTCALSEAPQRVGYAPPVPATVPKGYTLTHVATDPLDCLTHPLGMEELPGRYLWFNELWGYQAPAGSKEPHTEVGLTYTRGFDTLWVEAAPSSGPGSLPAERLVEEVRSFNGIIKRTMHEQRLTAGSFAGATALTWYDPDGVVLLVWNDRLVVALGGAVTRAQALAVAESLQPYAP